jgi:hypothetical protein
VTGFATASLSAWQNFYVIIGSSAAALIGLQFVVVALFANLRRRLTADSISAFGTPTATHLGGALILSAIMSAPWPSLFSASLALGTYGIAGLVYGTIVIRRARRQKSYQPVLEDWLWHAILPCTIYAAQTLAAVLFRRTTQLAMFVTGGAALGLLLIGIHNAWDSVIYMLVTASHEDSTKTQ